MTRIIGCLVLLTSALVARAQSWPPIDSQIPVTGGGENDAAVVVGIDKYFTLPAVPGAADNASAWQQWFLRVRKTPADRVVVLKDADATKGRVERAVLSATSSVKPGGTMWLVFIGHGAPSPSGDDGLLLGVDTQADADSLSERGISQKAILATLDGGKQSETIAIFDACFSGKTYDGGTTLVPGLQATLPVRRAPARSTVLAASGTFAGPLPREARPGFSYLLLGGLRGWADTDDDDRIAVTEAFDFTRRTMQAVLQNDSRLPSILGPKPSLVVIGPDAAPDIDALVAGRCPSGTHWVDRQCVTAPSRIVGETLPGHLSNAEAVGPLRGVAMALRACFASDPGAEDVVLVYSLTGDGFAHDVTLEPASVGDRPFAICMRQVVASLSFPRFDGKPKVMRIPIKLPQP